MAEKLKVGILLDSYDLYAWQRFAIEKIKALEYVDLALVIVNQSPAEGAADLLLYRLYRRLDRMLFGVNPDAFSRKNEPLLFDEVDQLDVTPRQTRFSDYVEGKDLEDIRGHNLDVLVRFGFRILRGEILNCARHGVWSYHHGDSSRYRGGPPCLWELLEAAPDTGTVLQVLNEDLDSGKVLYRSWSSTDKLSLTRSKNRVYWKSASFLARALTELYLLGSEGYHKQVSEINAEISSDSARLYRLKDYTNLGFGLLLCRHLWRNLLRKFDEWTHLDQWYLLYRRDEGGSTSFADFQMLSHANDRFWTVPSSVNHQGS